MKLFTKVLALVLICCTLCSCAGGGAGETSPATDTSAEPPVTEAPEKIFDLTGTVTYENGSLISTRGQSAFALSEKEYKDNFKVSCDITVKAAGISGIMIFTDGEANGIYLAADFGAQNVSLYMVKESQFEQLGRRKCSFEKNQSIPMSIQYSDGVIKAYFNENPADTDPYPKFEVNLSKVQLKKLPGNKVGFRVGNAIADFRNISITEADHAVSGDTYTNPVIQGADPDVLFYNGVYYLYQRVHGGNDVFRVSTSTDLVNWKTGNVIYKHNPRNSSSSYMSPNVFHYNGKFYLIFAAKNPTVGNHTLYCAVSDTPDGNFVHAGGQRPIHDNVAEIGGHPYIDPDTGKLYLSLVRFGGGNHIWMEEFSIVDDHLVPVEGTLSLCISPDQSYEKDSFGNISEGGVIIKHNGLYYMIYASGHYKGHYGEAYAISENVLGPYTKYENNDFLTFTADVDGCGDAIITTSPDGKELFLVYHMHSAIGTVEPRLTCIDRMKFIPDPNGGPDIISVYGPTSTPQPMPSGTH